MQKEKKNSHMNMNIAWFNLDDINSVQGVAKER